MSHSSKKWSVLVLVLALGIVFASPAFAAEGENKLTNFFKKLFHVPAKTVENTADTAGTTLHNTGDKVLHQTGEHLSQGQVGEAMVQPVVGSAETVGQTAAETVQIVPDAINSDPNASSTTS